MENAASPLNNMRKKKSSSEWSLKWAYRMHLAVHQSLRYIPFHNSLGKPVRKYSQSNLYILEIDHRDVKQIQLRQSN
jgi:hypothetical protein